MAAQLDLSRIIPPHNTAQSISEPVHTTIPSASVKPNHNMDSVKDNVTWNEEARSSDDTVMLWNVAAIRHYFCLLITVKFARSIREEIRSSGSLYSPSS